METPSYPTLPRRAALSSMSTLPLARRGVAAAVAIRGERRVPLRVLGEAFDKTSLEAFLRRRLFPSFLGVLRMLKAIDWRRSACGKGSVVGPPSLCSCPGLSTLGLCVCPTDLFNGCFLLDLSSTLPAPLVSVPGSHGAWEAACGLLGL